MKPFRFNGRNHFVGGRIAPDPAELEALRRRGMFWDLVRGVKGQPPPTPPPETSYWQGAAAALGTMLGNDAEGDCAEACDQHLEAVRTANAPGVAAYMPTTEATLAEYSAITGYVPGDPATDRGTNELELFAWRKANPYPSGAELAEAIPVDATNRGHVELASWLAVGLVLCMSLPDAWQSEEQDGAVWDVAGPPDPQNGHCVAIVDYDAGGVWLGTWGERVRLTWRALAKYGVPAAGGALYALVAPDCVSTITRKAPSGFDLGALEAYLEGRPVPAPPPDPTPAPDPTPIPDTFPPGTFVDPDPEPSPVGPAEDSPKRGSSASKHPPKSHKR